MNPLFSIIIVSLNAESTITKTLESILNQTYMDYEIIVKDGRSNDKTLQMISPDEKIHIFSQPDMSVYDAMNQAIAFSKGKYIIFMNCGDCFFSNTILESVSEMIRSNQYAGNDIIYGNYAKKGKIYKQSSLIDRKRIASAGLCHQSVFTGKLLFDKYGDFDSQMRICADHEHMARLFVHGVEFHYIDETICDYQGDGISEKSENLMIVREEGDLIRKRYFSSIDIAVYNLSRLKRRMFHSLDKDEEE